MDILWPPNKFATIFLCSSSIQENKHMIWLYVTYLKLISGSSNRLGYSNVHKRSTCWNDHPWFRFWNLLQIIWISLIIYEMIDINSILVISCFFMSSQMRSLALWLTSCPISSFTSLLALVWPMLLAKVWTHYKIRKLNMWTLFCNLCIDFLNSQIWKEIVLKNKMVSLQMLPRSQLIFPSKTWFFVFILIFSGGNHLKINNSNILNPNLTK
jgi:hypothetical protein